MCTMHSKTFEGKSFHGFHDSLLKHSTAKPFLKLWPSPISSKMFCYAYGSNQKFLYRNIIVDGFVMNCIPFSTRLSVSNMENYCCQIYLTEPANITLSKIGSSIHACIRNC